MRLLMVVDYQSRRAMTTTSRLKAGDNLVSVRGGMGRTGGLIFRFDSGFFLVRRVKVEVNPAQGALVLGLAQDDRHLSVQSDAMPQSGAAADVGADGLVHERDEGGPALFGRLVNANDMLFESLEGFDD